MENIIQQLPGELRGRLTGFFDRSREAHKGNFGKILIFGGSWGMSGAAVLAGSAALRGGAGLVRVAIPRGIAGQVAQGNPCYTTIALEEDNTGKISTRALAQLMDLAQDNDTLGLGPGLGQGPGVKHLVNRLLRRIPIPKVVDADGLNALVGNLDPLKESPAPVVITPHPGEMARLVGMDIRGVQRNREEVAREFASRWGIVVVLKGHQTVVTDGPNVFINPTGNPGMATGGTGDVLTGLITALLGQGLSPLEAAQFGVFVHGLAGDMAQNRVGEVALIASDLLHHIPQAMEAIRQALTPGDDGFSPKAQKS